MHFRLIIPFACFVFVLLFADYKFDQMPDTMVNIVGEDIQVRPLAAEKFFNFILVSCVFSAWAFTMMAVYFGCKKIFPRAGNYHRLFLWGTAVLPYMILIAMGVYFDWPLLEMASERTAQLMPFFATGYLAHRWIVKAPEEPRKILVLHSFAFLVIFALSLAFMIYSGNFR